MLTWAIVSLLKHAVDKGSVTGNFGCILTISMACDVAIFYFLFKFQPWR